MANSLTRGRTFGFARIAPKAFGAGGTLVHSLNDVRDGIRSQNLDRKTDRV